MLGVFCPIPAGFGPSSARLIQILSIRVKLSRFDRFQSNLDPGWPSSLGQPLSDLDQFGPASGRFRSISHRFRPGLVDFVPMWAELDQLRPNSANVGRNLTESGQAVSGRVRPRMLKDNWTGRIVAKDRVRRRIPASVGRFRANFGRSRSKADIEHGPIRVPIPGTRWPNSTPHIGRHRSRLGRFSAKVSDCVMEPAPDLRAHLPRVRPASVPFRSNSARIRATLAQTRPSLVPDCPTSAKLGPEMASFGQNSV